MRIGKHKHVNASIRVMSDMVAHNKVTRANFSWPYTHFFTFLVNGICVGTDSLNAVGLIDVDIVIFALVRGSHDL